VTTATILAAGLGALAAAAFYVWIDVRRQNRVSSERIEQAVQSHLLASELELQAPFTQRILRPAVTSALKRVGGVLPGRNLDKMRQQLLIAGSPMGLGALDFIGMRIMVAAVGTFGMTLVLAAIVGSFGRALLAGLAGAILFAELPVFWLRQKMTRRQKEITLALPDALDMLTVCVDAGLGLESAFMRIGQGWTHSLAQELKRVVMEIGLGISYREAMRNLVYRTDVTDLSALVAVLLQAEQMGFSISDTLHTQADQMRVRRRQRAQELARAAPLKMLFPMVFFIMPATFAVVLGPAVPAIMEAFGGGAF
jgi:tight adherence protein C